MPILASGIASQSNPNELLNDATTKQFNDAIQDVQNAFHQGLRDTEGLREELKKETEKNQAHRQRKANLEAELSQLKSQMNGAGSNAGTGAVQHIAQMQAPVRGPSGGGTGFQLIDEILHSDPERTSEQAHIQAHGVAISSKKEETRIASAGWDARIKLYNLSKKATARTIGKGNQMGGLYSVAFAKTDDRLLGCTSADHSVYLWEWEKDTDKPKHKLSGHKDEVNGIDFHPLQNVMCTASDDMYARIWDFGEGVELRKLGPAEGKTPQIDVEHTKAVYGATFLGEDKTLQYCVATCCFDQYVRIFDMRDKSLTSSFCHHTDDIIGIDHCSYRNHLVTGSDDGMIVTLDGKMNWREVVELRIDTRKSPGMEENEVKRVRFSSDGKLLAAGCSTHRVLVYKHNGNAMEKVADLGGHAECVFDVAWSTCHETGHSILVSASHDGKCKVWRGYA